MRRILTDQNERAHEFGEELLGDEDLVLRDLLQTNVGQLQHPAVGLSSVSSCCNFSK